MPRYVQFTLFGKHRWGRAEKGGIQSIQGDPFRPGASEDGAFLPFETVELLPPARPSKIVCVGRNYRAHAAELNNPVPAEPLLFLKPPSCLIADGSVIEYPTGQTQLVHHEGELALVISRRTKNVAAHEAKEHVLGYTLMNDVTARDLQRKDVQFTRAKGFDTFGPCGPWLDTDFEPSDQRLTVTVNGELRQDGRLSEMVFGPLELVSYISRIMTLEFGDIISTGTPSGVGPLLPGDHVAIDLEGLGTLENHVAEAEA